MSSWTKALDSEESEVTLLCEVLVLALFAILLD